MNVLEKISNIFSVLENRKPEEDPQSAELLAQAKVKERNDFTNVLIDNLKEGKISYDEAVLRAKKFAQDVVDQNTILARISEYEIPLQRTASENPQFLEVEDMDPITEHLNRLSSKFGLKAYSGWLKDNLVKEGWYMGTGDRVDSKEFSIGIEQKDEKYVKESIKEGDKQMSQNEKKREDHLRAKLEEKGLLKDAWHLGTGDAPDHGKWDLNVGAVEDKRIGEGVREMEKQRKEDEKMREEHLRATKNMVDVVFSADKANVKQSTWTISEKKTGDTIVVASIDDILEGKEAPVEVIKELSSDGFKEAIYTDIAERGLETTAKALLAEKFDKLAAEQKTAEKKEDKKEEKKEKKEGEEEVEKMKKTEMYFKYRGIFADLKENILKLAEVPQFKGLTNLVKKAEMALEETKGLIDVDAPAEDIGGSLDVAQESLGSMNDADSLGNELKTLIDSDNPEDKEQAKSLVDQLVGMAAGAGEGLGEGEGMIEIEEGPSMEGSMNEEKPEAPTPKHEKKETKSEEEEEEKKEKKEPPKKAASLVEKLKKMATGTAMKREEGDYDVTGKQNFKSEFHGKDGKMEDDFTNIWEIAKEMESLAGKKASGKLAAFIEKLKKVGKDEWKPTHYELKSHEVGKSGEGAAEDVNTKDYLNKVIGDPKYVSDWMKDKTPEQMQAGWEKETKDTGNVYASAVEKTKLAYKAALDMQKKGLIKEGDEQINKQISNFMNMDEKSFNAYLDSLEVIAPSTEMEDGRFKVEVMAKAEDNKVVRAYIDGVPVAKLTSSEIEATSGKVTKAALRNAIELVKQAFKEGFFDNTLSDGKIEESAGEDISALNLGVEDTRQRKI